MYNPSMKIISSINELISSIERANAFNAEHGYSKIEISEIIKKLPSQEELDEQYAKARNPKAVQPQRFVKPHHFGSMNFGSAPNVGNRNDSDEPNGNVPQK